ncbi:hypothetical protein K2X85_08515 [bacterium]|nr:hypothetical protein [bacterium]
MLRTVVTLSVVVGLLLCPLRCFGMFRGSAFTSESTTSCCSDHCCDSRTDHQPEKENTPSDDCECEQCLCKGCLVESALKVAVEISLCVDPFASPLEIIVFSSDSECSLVRVDPVDASRSGWMLRITLQSMLL